jgi:sec-independent protein translocase protein TatB
MFDIGWGELLVIGIVALVVIGPKELPGVLRTLGQAMAKVRRMASEFQGQFQEAMREAEMHDIKKQVDDAAKGLTSYDPLDPDGLKAFMEPETKTAPAETPAAPVVETAALPEPDLGTPEAPKESVKPGEGGAS